MVKNLTDSQREEVKDFLLMNSTKMIMHNGKLKEASEKWLVSSRSISNIWTIIRKQTAAWIKICVKSKKKKKGKKGQAKIIIDIQRVKAIKLKDRKTLETFAKSYGVGKTTVWRWLKLGLLRAHTNSVHLLLTPRHKLLRLKFSLGALVVEGMLGKIKFKTMSNLIHIDEKWFYLTEICGKYYLLPGEEEPYRACQNKRYITKVMFMCAVARTKFAENGECIFDARSDGFHIKLVQQPPQSPDMNINDLGFFRAIQSLQAQSGARNVVELLQAVADAFEKLEPTTLNKVCISLQACLIEVMKRRGHNDYSLPQLKKGTLQKKGELSQDLPVDECLVRECLEYLIQVGAQVDNPILMQQLGYIPNN